MRAVVDKFVVARVVQVGFWITGLIFLAVVYSGYGGVVGMGISLAATVPFVWGVFALRCKNCGVSYYYDPALRTWNISGVNLLKTVKPQCSKCGAPRRKGWIE